jgi:hypothetical protein
MANAHRLPEFSSKAHFARIDSGGKPRLGGPFSESFPYYR